MNWEREQAGLAVDRRAYRLAAPWPKIRRVAEGQGQQASNPWSGGAAGGGGRWKGGGQSAAGVCLGVLAAGGRVHRALDGRPGRGCTAFVSNVRSRPLALHVGVKARPQSARRTDDDWQFAFGAPAIGGRGGDKNLGTQA